jgi:predicted metalloprotease with PDZ domain
LWSGDWREDSAAVAEELAKRRAETEEPVEAPAPAPAVGGPSAAGRLRTALARLAGLVGRSRLAARAARSRLAALRLRRPARLRAAAVLALAALLIAGGAFGLRALLHSGGSASAAASGSMPWLGVQLESVAPGAVVIATVLPGSPAVLAGLEPGDVITEINNQPVRTLGDVAAAVSGLGAGDQVQLLVSRGSTIFTTQATLAARPSGNP